MNDSKGDYDPSLPPASLEEAKRLTGQKPIWRSENYRPQHAQNPRRLLSEKVVPPNAKCLCESGKKYKKCCGARIDVEHAKPVQW